MNTGGCADTLQNEDSDTAAALMALFEISGNEQWLNKSRDLANLSATWTVSFDYQLARETPLAKLGAKFKEGVWASTQNKHGAPGFCTLSGGTLFKTCRATGDVRYSALMRDIIHAHAEGIHSNRNVTACLNFCGADSRGSMEMAARQDGMKPMGH